MIIYIYTLIINIIMSQQIKRPTYKSIFNNPHKEGQIINIFNTACIYDTKLINYYNNKLTIHDLITDEIITKDIIINNNSIRKIIVSANIDYIFILYSEYKNNILCEYIAKINDYNVDIFELNGFINSIYNYNNYLILVETDNRKFYITDFNNNIIHTFYSIFAIEIKISNNYIIVSDMKSFNPFITNILIFKFDENIRKLKFIKEFDNKSCAIYSNNEEYLYVYDNNKEIIYIYNNLWEIINTISTKINENSYFYKNYRLNNICLFPNNEHIMLFNYRTTQLWNNKYIGTIDKNIMHYNISHDENYLIALCDDNYYIWKIQYGKFKIFKMLLKNNNIVMSDEIWNCIENYIIL